jgi:hypothetical protein
VPLFRDSDARARIHAGRYADLDLFRFRRHTFSIT